MGRFTHWLKENADGSLALLIAVTVGLLAVLGVLGVNETGEVNAAILLTLALLATTLPRDRKFAAKTLADSSAVRLINGSEVGAVHRQAHRETEYWMFKGGTGTYLRAVTIKACAYSRELVASFGQTRPVPVAKAKGLPQLLELKLPGSYTDRDIADVIHKAVKPKNPYW